MFLQSQKTKTAVQESSENIYRQFIVVNRVSNQMDGIVDDLVGTSENVKQAAKFIAESTTEQSMNAENCIKLTDDFTLKMNDMDHKSVELIRLAKDMSDVNKRGNDSIVNLSLIEEKNQKAIEELIDRIHTLLEKVNSIGKVVAIIRSISQQTDLLSFNAKVEAVHAGKYGQGFGVVADEIKKLSDESRMSSENINEIIESLTTELGALQATLNKSVEIFTDQTKSVDSVIEAFKQINQYTEDFITEQNRFNGQVSGLKAQNDQLVDSMKYIFTGIQESASTTEELDSLAMSQNTSTAILGRIAGDLANEVGEMSKTLDKEEIEKLSENKKKISVIYDIESPFWEPTTEESLKAAKAFNVELDFFAPKLYSTCAAEMEKKLDQIIAEKRDGLIISPIDDNRVEEKLKQLNAAGTKIIFINSKLNGISYESLIETNGISAGKSAAKVAKKYLNNQGEAIVGIWTDEHISSIDNRAKGFVEELRSNSNIIVHEVGITSGATNEEAEIAINDMLHRYPQTKLVFSTNVGWGMLYAQYVKKHKPDLKVITMDFTKDIKNAIKEGNIDSAIAQRAFLWGTMSLDSLDKAFHGKSVQKYADTGTYEVNQSNIEIYEGRV